MILPNISFNEWAQGLDNETRFKILYGGRGSSKSWTVARKIILKQLLRSTFCLCTRELQKSIKSSVRKLMAEQIEEMGFTRYFKILETTIEGRFNRSQTVFMGMARNSQEVKSLEGLDLAWCEEAEKMTKESWRVLIPTVRKPGSEIWATFNPEDELGYTYQNFVINPRQNSTVIKVNFYDNAFFPDVLREEMEHDRRTDEALWRHIWLGEPLSDPTGKIINPIWVSAAIDAHKKLKFNAEGRRSTALDVSDGGVDFSAFISVQGPVVQEAEEWKTPGGDVGIDAQKVFGHALDRRDDIMIFDNIGVGAGVKSKTNELNLNRPNPLSVVGFNAASTALFMPDAEYQSGKLNRDMFANVKSQAWWALRDRFHKTYIAVKRGGLLEYDPSELISIPAELKCLPKLKAELCQPLKDFDGSGKFLVESKKKLLKRGVASTNLADCLAMNYAPNINTVLLTGGVFEF